MKAFALALVVTVLAGSPVGQRAEQFAAKCGVTISDFRERVFADGGNDKWKEYGSAKEFPAPEQNGSRSLAFGLSLGCRPLLKLRALAKILPIKPSTVSTTEVFCRA